MCGVPVEPRRGAINEVSLGVEGVSVAAKVAVRGGPRARGLRVLRGPANGWSTEQPTPSRDVEGSCHTILNAQALE